jgi:phosphoribosyl-ATP pyrophosphohydrolase
MSYEYIQNEIEIWGHARGIIKNGKPLGQALKTLEETTELIQAIVQDDRTEIIDAIGDIGVTLLMQCAIQGVTFTECLEAAYKQIKDRKGYLRADGVFVKESP